MCKKKWPYSHHSGNLCSLKSHRCKQNKVKWQHWSPILFETNYSLCVSFFSLSPHSCHFFTMYLFDPRKYVFCNCFPSFQLKRGLIEGTSTSMVLSSQKLKREG
uniref:Uncharacterized protein n=1 Tax=Cacopsylla melanoneura TaxID=428564 RepID=A0A8D8XGI7_9HEMI